jgi:AcrR family transcriptional regulator
LLLPACHSDLGIVKNERSLYNVPMPRVSDAHLAARREQILDAARRCFSRNGFHATSMQDVISEAGLSVGAVYRYFKSKDEIRVAVAEETAGSVIADVAEVAHHEPPLALAEAMARVMAALEPRVAEPDSVARIAIQAWAEALRDPSFAEFVEYAYRTMRTNFVTIARRAQEAGHLAPDADPEAIGAVLFGIVPGYILQRIITGYPDQATFVAGLRALLAA